MPEPGNPQDLNRYTYVRNNPVRYSDPTGHWLFEDDPGAVRYIVPPKNTEIGQAVGVVHPGDLADVSPVSTGELVAAATSPLWISATVLGGIALVEWGAGSASYVGVRALDEAQWTLIEWAIRVPFLRKLLGLEDLPDSVLVNFTQWRAVPRVGRPGEVYFRVHSAGRSLGPWWTRTRPLSEIQWRIDQAVRFEWNTAEKISILRIPARRFLLYWEGEATYQGGIFVGGGNQIYIPKVPQDWVITLDFSQFLRMWR